MQENVRLVLPDKKYIDSYIIAANEYKLHNVDTYSFYDPQECDIFAKFENYRLGRNLPEKYVKATYLWLVENDNFIGEVSIRHSLTDSLMKYGGNIGYGIRYSKWNKGYGTKMLKMALPYARDLGLSKVLITCNDDNYGSAKVIEKNGGVLWDKISNIVDGKSIITRRYWIEL
jgi:predicted acetyltransferase